MVNTVMFDLSDVLICGLIGIDKELCPVLGQSRETILSRFGGDRLQGLCRGELSEDNYLSHLLESAGWSVPLDDLKRAIRRNFHHQVEGMVPLVQRLSGKYPLVLVSDHAREWIEYIERIHPFLALFQRRIYSFETGMLKSDTACFPRVLAMLQRRGEECVFTDDTAGNVDQARAAGIHGILFRNREGVVAELERIGIAVRD